MWMQERISESPSADISSHWEAVEESEKFPLLVKVAKAVFILPHQVNAEVERTFLRLSDIVTKKRTSLHAETVRALVVSKFILRAKSWNSVSISVTHELLQ